MKKKIRDTRSVCPVCLKNIPAKLVEETDGIYLEKVCEEHGSYHTLVWRNQMDLRTWMRFSEPLREHQGLHCPDECGICGEHESGSCCVLLEVTRRCNLSCTFCFAKGGSVKEDPSQEDLKESISDLAARCDHPLLQLSGGEPTLREDLPELVRYAKDAGCSYVQINTNGIRLAQDPEYVKRLAVAGTDIIFLQFDGTKDSIYQSLRGRPLLETKLRAIENCAREGLGVTLVPTVVSGVNDQNLGELVGLAAKLVPKISGIHFQPVSYFGRYPHIPDNSSRYTLDQLMYEISEQTGIPVDSFMPSRCDHPLCGFHSNYIVEPSGNLRPVSSISHTSEQRGCARDNREYVARHWKHQKPEKKPENLYEEEMDFDAFLYCLKHSNLTLSAMAFQDAMNLNVERLHRCSLHVYNQGRIVPFCANYLTSMKERKDKDQKGAGV